MDLRNADILSQTKEFLNKEEIKLWLPPYHGGLLEEEDQAMLVLSKKVSEKLNISEESCLYALKDLQTTAIERLKSNEVFQETGIACLRVKVSGENSVVVNINISLTSIASELIVEVANATGIAVDRIKLIAKGKVLEPAATLASQGVKNGMHLMAVVLADVLQLKESEKRFNTLENTKKDVQYLAGKSHGKTHEYYFEVENQSGEALNLPYHERKALVTAMAFHEKGKAALKREDYSLALVFFLEADKAYSDCPSDLLKGVDNYAVLHLDIAWCYLCLRNSAQIPDADRRLSLCEQSFNKTYGPNLERLMTLKGTAGDEAALFMRLHLLQGVVLFHQNKRAEARSMFLRAQSELNVLKVDDNSIILLMEFGFSNAEARFGLRATQGNIEAAEELLHRKRKEKDLAHVKNRLKRKEDMEGKRLGLCADGKNYCSPSLLKQLQGMGFEKSQSIAALRMANNSIGEALTIIQESPHLLACDTGHNISEESIAQAASLGFEPEVAREALRKMPELQKVVKSLTGLSNNNNQAGTSDAFVKASASAITFLDKFCKKRKLEEEKELEAFERFSQDLLQSQFDDDYPDINLAQEEQFLAEYMSLLN